MSTNILVISVSCLLTLRNHHSLSDALAVISKACDALSASEIVVPLRSRVDEATIGVLDLDSTVKNTFDEEDKRGLERIVALLRI
jgi:putative methionine-R-sulfoxide reductase with GAF domain